jgi:hypothetical protein
MQVDLIDARPGTPPSPGRADKCRAVSRYREVQLLDCCRPSEVGTLVDILDHHQADEVLVGVLVVEGEADERPQRQFRFEVVELQRRLDLADAAVGVLEHLNEEPLLVAEVVIDHPLAGIGARGNIVDPRPSKAFVGKLIGRDLQDVPAGSFRVLNPCSMLGPGRWIGTAIQPSRTLAMHAREGAEQGLVCIYRPIDLEVLGLNVLLV